MFPPPGNNNDWIKQYYQNTPQLTPATGTSPAPSFNTNTTQPLPPTVSLSYPQQYNPYQIQTGDTFESIARKAGMSAEAVLKANNGMVVPPPKGSYINLPNGMQALGPAQMGGMNPQPAMNPNASPYAGEGRANFATAQKLIDEIQLQIQAGNPPRNVPASLLGALDATPASMQAAGYVFNAATQTWTNSAVAPGVTAGVPGSSAPGGGGAQSDNNWMTNPALKIITFNRNAKNKNSRFTTTLKWAQNAWRRKRRQAKGIGINQAKSAPAAPAESSNAGGTPETVLGLHLGSG